MKGIVLTDENPDRIALKELDTPRPQEGQVLVKIYAAALNHRDQWCREGRYPNLTNGVILGSDGAGTVAEVGQGVDASWKGKEVIINAAMHWGEDQKAQSRSFQIIGMPSHGTFAEYIVVPADRITDKPAHLTFHQAAALPLGGLTAFRSVFYHGKVEKGDKVLVTGFGGGVAQFAAQFALLAGAEVYVSSGSNQKLEEARKLGVQGGFNYRNDKWADAAKEASGGGFDLIIDSAVGDTWGTLLKLMKPGAKLVFYGATLGNPSTMDMRRVFWNQLTIQGSTMGSDADFAQMVDFVNQTKLVPVVDRVFELENALEAFERMKAAEQTGKIVLQVG